MKITRTKDKFIIEIDSTTTRYNPYDESEKGEMDTLVGLIAQSKYGNYEEMGLATRIDMSYKGKGDQVGEFVVMWQGSKENFIKMCKKNKIDIITY